MKNKKVFTFGIIGLLVLAFAAFAWNAAAPGKYDEFATCLKDKGVTFYGAFWCPHCAAQKELFGNSVKKLPYVECSTADSQGQTQVCKDKGIKTYPTWYFADGSSHEGEMTLAELSEKSTCPLNK